MANNNQRMITMPDGRQYPLMPQPTPNPYAGRAAAQEAVQQQQPVADTTANPDVQAFAQGKAAANTTPNLFRTPVTEPYIRAAINKPAVIQRNNTTPQEQTQNFVQERQQEQQQNNKPITSMEELARAMGYTSPEDERKMRRASLMNQRILAVGDALRHIGNIANTVGYAPSQQFNNPALEEQARYEKGKAMRDRANQQYIAYQQAKAKQDAEQKRWEQQFGLQQANAASQHAYRQAQAQIAAQRTENQRAYQEGNLARQTQADADRKSRWERQDKETQRYHSGMLGVANRRVKDQERRTTAYVNSKNGSGGKVVPLNTPNGMIIPSGGKPNPYQMKQVYYAAKEIDDKNKDANGRYKSGYVPLTKGGVFSWSGSDEDFNKVYEALNRSGELADWAHKNLGWQYGNAASGGDSMDLGLDDDEEDEMDLGLD